MSKYAKPFNDSEEQIQPSAASKPESKYADSIRKVADQRKLLLNRALKRSLGNPPDEIASILGLSRNTGLSPELVRNNKEDVEYRVKQREIGAQVASLSQPGQEWLTEKYNLDISQDDLANIKAMDDAITNKSWYEKDFLDKLMDSSVKTGTINVRQMASSIEATPGMNRIPEFDRIDELLAEGDREAALSYIRENDRALAGTALKADLLRYIGAEPEDRAELRAMSMEQISRSASQIAQQESERQAIPNHPGLTRAMEDGSASAVLGAIADDPGIIPLVTVESLITSVPSLAAGVFGTMSGALPAAAGSAMASYGTERGLGLISALRDAGVDTSDPDQLIAAMTDPSILEDAQRRAELKALPISMLDMLGAGLASRLLAPTSVAGKTLTTRQREAINLFTQMPVQGIQEGAGEASGQYLADGEVNTAEVALETIAGAFGSTSDVLAFSGNRVFESVVNNANSYRRAKKDRAYLTAVKDAANQTQLRKRDPQALKELLNRLSQTGPVDEIYISGKDFQELFQSKNLDPEEYAQKMESVGQQYHESLLTGGDIAVSVADFAAVIAPTEAAEDFILRARTKTDGMSPAEADQWMNEQARPTLEAIINYDGDQAGQSAQKVFDDVVGQLLATGMDQQTAERNASLYRAFFDVMSQTEDVDPFDLYQQYNLAITREMPEILKRRDNNVDALDPLLDRLRSGDVPSQQSIFGASLTDFLREQGGVQDYAGELSAMDADKTRQAFQRNLVSEQGLDLATAAERAAEAGYIESRDTNQLLAALDTELRGEPVYSKGGEDAKLQETATDLMALQEELDRLGIDLAEVDNATAKEALNTIAYGGGQTDADTVLSQDEMQVDEVTDNEEIRRILEKYQSRQGAQQQVTDRTVGGGQADRGWREATSLRGSDGQPAKLYRGASRPLSEQDFALDSLGQATNNPSAPLGVWFTSDQQDASRYGAPSEYYADVRNPAVYASDDVPAFQSAEEAIALREQLRSEGYDGIVFDYSDVEGPIHVVAFEASQAILPDSVELNQDLGGKRGVIRIDRTNRNFNIELLAKADLSTFLHESGHFFLEVLGDLSQREGASDRVKGQYQTILDWFEVKSRDQIGVEQHEQFARGFEAYLMEGKAPTPELQSVFARFRAWLMAVYKRLTALNVDLTDEVRNVMDRILATDEEIERARGDAGMTDSLSDVAAMEWTEKERADYRDLVEEAREAAKSELIARQMKDLRKTEKDWYKQERAKVRDEVLSEMSKNRVYRALSHLQNGKLPDGSELPNGLQPVKLSKELLVAEYGAEFLKRLPGPRNKLYSGPYIYSREGGVSPEILADLYGFSSGDEMIQAFANARAMKPLAEAEADARMRERYPDINLSGEAAEAAIAAVHNDKAADRMLMELKKLHSKSRFAKTRMTPAHVLRQAAQRLIQGQRVKDVRPDLYRRAEARAANDAFTEATNNDFDSAFESKQRQLLNHYLYREAAAAREAAESTLEYVKRFNKKSTRQRIGKAGSDYLEQIDAIIDQYEFRRVSLKQISRRRSLQSWVDELKADGIEPEIPQSVLQQAQTVNYKEISVEELQGIRDALTSIEHLARTKNKLLSSQFKREFGETVDSIVSSIGAHHEIKREPPQFVRTNISQLKDWSDQYVASHAKPEFIFEYLDGNESMGPVWQSLFKPLSDAENAENKMTGEVMERLTEIMGDFKKEQRAHWFAKKTYIPEVSASMTKANMIALALNWGNEGNRQAVLEGYGWSQSQAWAILSKLSEADWKMAQDIWDLVDSFWPQISQLQKDLTGLAPEKVERTPVETPFGILPGGYYPLKYDPRSSFLQFKRDEGVNTQDLFENNFFKPATKKGHTIERVGSAGMQVRLDLAVLGEHIYQVIHDLSHRRAIIDVDRLLSNVKVRHAIEGSAGREAYRQLRPWLQAIANDTRPPTLPWEKIISRMRGGGTIVNMGWKFTTAIVQPLGYLQSVDQIGAKWAWKGLRDFYGSPDKMAKQVDFVFERSEAMKNRQRNFDRDVRDYARRLEREGKMDGVRESFFWMTGMLDMSVSVPTWLGAYRKAMEGHVPNAAKGDEAAAIDYADQAVRESQSSGAVKDLARVQRGHEAFRAFTMFYSYFSALFNLLRRRRQDLQLGNINLPQFAASMAVLWIAPAVLGELVAMRGPDDDEEWAKWAAQQSILYPFQTMIGVRDVANAALTPFGFGASPAYDGLEQTARALQVPYKALTGEDVKRSDVKSIVLATSYWGHLPGRQAWITGEYLFDLMDGKENPENPAELLDGLMFSRPASER